MFYYYFHLNTPILEIGIRNHNTESQIFVMEDIFFDQTLLKILNVDTEIDQRKGSPRYNFFENSTISSDNK